MKAMILAAGLGTRLGALTANLPKCLMPIGSTTILGLVVEQLRRAGVTELVINLHHHAEKVRAYVEGADSFGMAVQFSYEAELLETGGGIRHARKLLATSEPLIVHNADIFTDADLAAAVAAHRTNGHDLSLLVMDQPSARSLLFDEDLRLVGWENAGEGKIRFARECAEPLRRAFTGISILSESFLSFLDRYNGRFSVVPAWLDAVAEGLNVRGTLIDGARWVDVGTPEELQELRRRVATRVS
jgi:NDP-sugar pyrophosphorylase family protein